MIKVDLHVHTWYSDSRASVKEVIDEARRKGLNGIAITDHNTMDALKDAKRLKGNLIIIPGEEVWTCQGEILALGIRKPIRKGLRIMDAIRRVHSQNGIVIIPHPTIPIFSRIKEKTLRKLPIDGIEAFSAMTPLPRYFLKKNINLALRLKLPIVAGSDSHFKETVGDAYTIIDSKSSCIEDILDAIKLGKTKIGCKPSSWKFKVKIAPGIMISLLKTPLTYKSYLANRIY